MIRHYMARLLDIVEQRATARRSSGRAAHDRGKGGYRGLPIYYAALRAEAKSSRNYHHGWERTALRAGLKPWVEADIRKVYDHMDAVRKRCKTPHILEDAGATPQ